MTRYTIYLRCRERGWEWSSKPNAPTWWGYYEKRGTAIAAAKRSMTKVVNGKTNPKDWTIVQVGQAKTGAPA